MNLLEALIRFITGNKGRASIYILRTAFGVDWSERIKIIYAGDDATDEDALTVSFLTAFLELLMNILLNNLRL